MKLEEAFKIINEKDPSDRGYKALATSVGIDNWKKVKSYLKSKKVKSALKNIKKNSKKAKNPEAYIASVERKMLKHHFKKEESK